MFPIRDDQPSYSTPWVNYFIIGLNTVVFLFELSVQCRGGERSMHWYFSLELCRSTLNGRWRGRLRIPFRRCC